MSASLWLAAGQEAMDFPGAELSRYGFWSVADEPRADFCMLPGYTS